MSDTLVRLRGIAAALANADDADQRWLAAALDTWLAPGSTISIEAALGLAATARAAYWRTERDRALRQLAAIEAPGQSGARRVAAVSLSLRRYRRDGRWSVDRHRHSLPADYTGTARQYLFEAFRAGAGRVPMAASRLWQILASDCNHDVISSDLLSGDRKKSPLYLHQARRNR